MPNQRAARDCEICTVTYRPSYPGQRACGRKCGWQIRVREGAVPQKQSRQLELPALRECAHCARPFVPATRRTYCSTDCYAAARRAADLVRYGVTPDDLAKCRRCGRPVPFKRRSCDGCLLTARQAERRRSRARRRAVHHEPYTLAEIAARDDYRCGICHRHVTMALAVPDFLAPTIDHVLAIANGGQDTPDNVQLAHFICNSRKADRMAAV